MHDLHTAILITMLATGLLKQYAIAKSLGLNPEDFKGVNYFHKD